MWLLATKPVSWKWVTVSSSKSPLKSLKDTRTSLTERSKSILFAWTWPMTQLSSKSWLCQTFMVTSFQTCAPVWLEVWVWLPQETSERTAKSTKPFTEPPPILPERISPTPLLFCFPQPWCWKPWAWETTESLLKIQFSKSWKRENTWLETSEEKPKLPNSPEPLSKTLNFEMYIFRPYFYYLFHLQIFFVFPSLSKLH